MRKLLSCLVIAVAAASVALWGGRALAQPASPALKEVRDLYYQARDGAANLEDAEKALTGFLARHPRHPVATVFLGSVKAMIARDSFFPFKKLAYVNRGTELLDEAVSRLATVEPEAHYDGRIDILMVSGQTNANLPKVFGRRQFAERDLRQVAELPGFAGLPGEARAKVYAWLAVLAAPRDRAEAERLLTKGVAADRATAEALWAKER